MTHYWLTVHGPAERNKFGSYASKEEMEEAFAATGAFNGHRRTRPGRGAHARGAGV